MPATKTLFARQRSACLANLLHARDELEDMRHGSTGGIPNAIVRFIPEAIAGIDAAVMLHDACVFGEEIDNHVNSTAAAIVAACERRGVAIDINAARNLPDSVGCFADGDKRDVACLIRLHHVMRRNALAAVSK